MKLLATAGNVLSGILIAKGIELVARGLDSIINSAENAKEATEGFVESYGSLQSEFKSNTTTISELQKQYTKLSEGVDSLGGNVSLTNDEYNSYKDIISQLSDIMPDLAVRYNEQGEKIGFVQGKLKDLNAEYDKYKQRQAIKMITDGDEDGNKIKDTIKNYRNQGNPLVSLTDNPNREKIRLLQMEIDNSGIGPFKELTNEEIEKKKSEIQQYQAEIDNAVAAIQDSLSLLAQSNNEYYKLTDEQQNYVDTFLGNITDEFIKQNGLDTEDGMRVFVNSIIDGLNKNKNGVADAYRELFSFDFETTEMTPEEINEKVDKMVQNIADILNIKDVRQLKISLGFQFVEDNANQYDNTLNKFKTFDPATLAKDPNHNSKIDAFANNNNVTQEELEALAEKGYDATTSINVLENALKSLRATTESANKQSIEKAWLSLVDTDDEELKNTKEDLLELAKAGKLTEAAFHSTTGADTFLNTINESLPEAINWINSLTTSSDQLSNLQSNISSIQGAFSDFKENGSASAETLAGMSDELKQLDGWKDFAETLGDSSSSAEECRKAMNDLATEYVNSNNFLSQLDDTNKDYYISTLSNMDVENAEEIVMKTLETKTAALAAEKKWCAEKGRELSTATKGEIADFIKEQGYSQQTGIALYQLALKKQLVNGTTLDFSGDIRKIIEYVEYINGAARSLRTLNDIKNGKYSVPDSDLKKIKKSSQGETDDALNKNTGAKIKIDPPSSKNSSGSGTSGSKGSKSSKDSKQEIDWIERKLEVLQKNIDATKAKFENLFSVKAKSSNLDKQIRQTTKLMNAASKVADKYKKKAENYAKSSGLSKSLHLQNAAKNGRLDKYKLKDLIKKYGDKTANKIQEYQKWYDKYKEERKQVDELTTSIRKLREEKYQLYVDDANARIDKSKAWMELDSGNYKEQNKHLNAQKKYIADSYKYQIKIAELNRDSVKVSQLKAEKEKELRDIEKQKFDNIANQYENELSVTQAKQDAISREIDLIQARGDMLDQSKYKSQIAIENEKIASLEQEKQLLEEQLKLKKLVEGTDEWYEALGVIEDVKANIDNSKQSISEMEKSINEIGETLRTKILDSFERIKTESDWLVGMMDKVEDFDDQTYSVTNEGITRLGSYISGGNVSKQQSNLIQQWLDELNANRDGNGEAHFTSSITGTEINYTADEYVNAWKDAYDQLRDYDSQYMDYKNKAIEWEISKLKNELSIMQDIIDAKKDVLQSEKDLYSYQKSIQQSTKNIGLLQKQIAAVQGDTSEEGIARIQKLQKELADAQDDLNETEYDRYISDQEELLDKLYQEYEELINSESKQREILFNRAIQDANNNANTIVNTNKQYADVLGYQFETNLQNLYSQNGSIGNNVASILNTLQNGIVVSNLQQSQSSNATPEPPTTPETTSSTEQLPAIGKEISNISFGDSIVAGLDMTRKEVENYIDKNGKNPVKGHSYKAVNATLADKYKKVLSDADLKDLAKKLGIKYDNSSKSGNLYNALKALQLSGFKKGGIATDLNKIALDNGDDGWVTVQRGEGILTPIQTETFKNFIPRMDLMMDSAKTLDALVKNANFERQQNPTNIDAHYEFNLENCTNASDIIRQIQTDSNIRKALQDVTINQIHKSGKSLGVNRFI